MFLGRVSSNSMRFRKYAFDVSRACTFAIEYREQTDEARSVEKCLITASMRQAVQRRLSDESAFPLANQRVADSVLGMFSSDLFDNSTGSILNKRIQQLRYDHAGDSQALSGMKVSYPEHLVEVDDAFDVPETSDVQRWPE